MRIQTVNLKEQLDHKHLEDDPLVIVFDVCFFSSTVISLFDVGIKKVDVLKDSNNDDYDIIGGEDDNIELDFHNSPQSVYGSFNGSNIPDKVGIISDNGSKACHKVKNLNEKCEIIIGSTVNANGIIKYIKENDYEDIVLLQSGSKGGYQFEDSLGSALVLEGLRGNELNNIDIYKESVKQLVYKMYPWASEEDIKYVNNFNSHSNVIPKSKRYYLDKITFENIKV